MIRWKEVSVSDLGKVITGNTPPRKNPELYGNHTIFIKPTDISEGEKYTYDPEECYSELGFKKYKNSLIPKGATCVVTIGSIGKKMTKAHCDCFINQAVNAVVPNEPFDEEFVYYVLKYNLEQLKGLDSGTASGRENVSKSSFSSIKLNVPVDKMIQTKIGQILCAYDDLIENNLKRIKLLEELAQRTYEEWFVKFRLNGDALEIDEETGLPVGWEMKRADELFNIKIGKTPPREQQEWFKKDGSGINWASIKDINNASAFIFNTTESITNAGVSKFNMNIATKGTVILSFKLTVGRTTILAEDMVTNEAIAHFNIPKGSMFKKEFVYCYLKQFNYHALGSTSSIGTAINSKIVKAMDFLVPEKYILKRFQKFVEPMFDKLENLQKQNLNLKTCRDILLPRLMNGTISVAVTATKIVKLDTSTQKQATSQFKEAILISLLTYKFGSEKYPLGRMRYTKLSYLFHRHADNQIKDYLRKAAGPYNPKTKYGGSEKIAQDNGYVVDHKSGQLTGFIAGPNIEKAKPYFESYWDIEYLTWLETQFKYKSNDDLELFATVDNSLIELNRKNEPFTVEAVKNIFKKEPEWTAKLEREIFNDLNILRAITYLPTIFHY